MNQAPLQLLTVTWAPDKHHFDLLRDSLSLSALADIPHAVVVHDEDLGLFLENDLPPVRLYSTRDVLPEEVERGRRRALAWQRLARRGGTRVLGSLARLLGRPDWVRYTGWHTQQLCKLAWAAASEVDTVVVLDSDVVVTPHARPADFLAECGPVCFQQWQDREVGSGKEVNWLCTAGRLFGTPPPEAGRVDCYFDTPFVLHAPSVRSMLQWLEDRYGLPWWRTLLALPPRRWSEFGIYKQYLRALSGTMTAWRDTDMMGYLFDASDPALLLDAFENEVNSRHRHYVTIHSQSSGRRLWRPDTYADAVRRFLRRRPPLISGKPHGQE